MLKSNEKTITRSLKFENPEAYIYAKLLVDNFPERVRSKMMDAFEDFWDRIERIREEAENVQDAL